MQYEKEFKNMISELYLSGRKALDLSTEYNLNSNMIHRWVKEYQGSREAFTGKGNLSLTSQEKEILDLKKALSEAQLERDILKKAVGIFSKNDK
jgi:transposase